MSDTNKAPLKPLQNCENAQDFVHKPGPAFLYRGKTYDLRTMTRRTAEALANDPNARFIQWADTAKRPKDQRDPLPAGATAKTTAKS